ncbi:hypothetical protein EAH87_16445 [Sphingomonas koreensis]|nr:hypothetical protein EAH87_16445 [Sphingomonas koreensis]
MKNLNVALSCALFISSSVSAQTFVPSRPPPAGQAAIAVGAAQPAVLRTGTEIALVMAEDLTTKGKKLRVGQRVHLKVADDVKMGGQVVIPAGSPAIGELTDVRNKGMWGKSGHIGAQLLYVEANGRQIRLSGQFDDKGVTGTAGVVAAIAFVPVAGFFTTGTSAHIPLGGAVNGFVDEDVPVAFATAAPAPMVVTAAPVSAPAETAPTAALPAGQPAANAPAVVTPAVAVKTSS